MDEHAETFDADHNLTHLGILGGIRYRLLARLVHADGAKCRLARDLARQVRPRGAH